MASKTLLSQQVTRGELAALIKLSERQIQRLTNKGVFALAQKRQGRVKYILGEAVSGYVQHLRETLSRDANAEAYSSARALRITAEAEMAQLKLQQYKGLLHHSSDVEFVVTNMLTFFKQRALAIPSRISRQLIGKRNFQAIYDVIMAEILACLNELSGYDSSMLAQQTAARLAEQGVDLASLENRNGAEKE
jgi:phage terminase Nu1 subunit (DNA packaging protein)